MLTIIIKKDATRDQTKKYSYKKTILCLENALKSLFKIVYIKIYDKQ